MREISPPVATPDERASIRFADVRPPVDGRDLVRRRLSLALHRKGRFIGKCRWEAGLAEFRMSHPRVEVEVEVAEQMAFAADAGIHSVPTFVIDRSIGVAGAQPAEVFSEILARAAAASS